MARDARRSVARVHLLLAGIGGALLAPTDDVRRRPAAGLARRRPAAGLAAGSATTRAVRAVVDWQAKGRVTGCSCRPYPPTPPQCPRLRPRAARSCWGGAGSRTEQERVGARGELTKPVRPLG